MTAAAFLCAAAPAPRAAKRRRATRCEPARRLPAQPRPRQAKLMQEKCTICHDLRNIVNANKDAEEWRETIHMMKAAGALINDAQVKEISDYFIANYPGLERPKPVVIAGPANIKFSELGDADAGLAPARSAGDARRHDLVVGAVRQPARPARSQDRRDEGIPDPGARRPHGLINDKDGNIWYAGNWGGHIGKLDPKTGEYKFYPMPDPKAARPAHAAVRQGRHPLVQRAERRLHGPARSQDRRHQAVARRSARPASSPMRCASSPTAGSPGSAISARTRSRPSTRTRWR